jgi:hypothetical protein
MFTELEVKDCGKGIRLEVESDATGTLVRAVSPISASVSSQEIRKVNAAAARPERCTNRTELMVGSSRAGRKSRPRKEYFGDGREAPVCAWRAGRYLIEVFERRS